MESTWTEIGGACVICWLGVVFIIFVIWLVPGWRGVKRRAGVGPRCGGVHREPVLEWAAKQVRDWFEHDLEMRHAVCAMLEDSIIPVVNANVENNLIASFNQEDLDALYEALRLLRPPIPKQDD